MDFNEAIGMGVSSETVVGGLLSCSSLLPDIEVSSPSVPFGSVLQKHERLMEHDDYDRRSVKAGPEALAAAPPKVTPFLLKTNSCPLFPYGGQMLSFSSRSKSEMVVGADGTLPYYDQPSSTSSAQCYIPRNAGISSHANMQGVLARVRGPFTPYQWLELEHQALIYKYLLANAPIPATLLVPLMRNPSASGFPLSAGSFASGYSRNADLEPGRCCRTDGKKWRCSRNAVADQKYCERHMNRSRHRSRKHVEGQSCHTAKVMPDVTSSQLTSAVPGATSSTPTVSQQQSKTLQSNITDPPPVQLKDSVEICRMLNNKEVQDDYAQNPKSISMPSPVEQRPVSNLYPFAKQHTLLEGTSHGRAFGLNSNDSLFNTMRSSFSVNISFTSVSMFNDQHLQSSPHRHIIDDWSKTQSEVLPASCPEVEETLCDRTKHAVSIPKSGSDFSSSSFNNKQALSPPKLSREYNLGHAGLSVGVLNDACQIQPNCRPISWEASMAGPLGEVLKCTSCNPKDQGKNSSSLHLMADDLDSNTRMDSSPTGVLQKTSFASLSSSTGGSPMADNCMVHEGTSSLFNDLLGSTLLN
ncbi:growth-regulating factor 6-like isoform X1 [Zingiber officinale]|uniref:Growth-regulating factor n=1 Tax=Zingiber officinale TaxID=94328 RepID=A0A8J5M0S5_ZINOF|nr:growth-regulating factor 6-like [Zingiber officinale]XP_042461414.1 growth-regulating factor 6-like isoform X1 [Zingiber officinale]KAG6466632.1 hypothetical protein ZIOFF_075570 [Zingiber officinale]KAG6530726.1 hypothetical protein ZIOFF_004484 [Zingiber officinale]